MTIKIKTALMSVVASAAFAALASTGNAQSLDYTSDSNFGSVSLETGFLPDPYTVDIVSGGSVNLADAIDSDVCAGYATSNPDYKLHWEQEDEGLLRLWVESDHDTTLVINDSYGNWHCDDDSYGNLNPLVELSAAGGGRYDIWVGSYDEDANHSSTLYISEISGNSASSSSGSLDYTSEANFGSVSLETGFLPDPYTVDIVSGGSVNLANAIDSDVCAGYATSNPDFKLQWSQADEGLLRLWVESDEDTTLVINDSNGQWHCDDDSFGNMNPLVELEAASGGRFDIWVGSYDEDANHSSTLYISEIAGSTGSSRSGSLDYTSEANFGSVSLETGFLPDPYTVDIVSGGSVDLSTAIDSDVCAGYATSNPDFKLHWEQEDEGLLRLWVESDEDTTLVINDSYGNWHCDDDSYGNLNPIVELSAAGGGRYDIWVGSYDQDANHSSKLYISELD